MHLAANHEALEEFKALLHEFTKNSSKWNKAHGYNVLNRRYEFISGEVKCYLPMSTKRPRW